MATLNFYSQELLKEKGLIIYLEHKPEEVCQHLMNEGHDIYIVKASGNRLSCPNCKRLIQKTATHCWHCARVLLHDYEVNLLTVKLVSNGIPVHGIVTAALASWNPCALKFLVRQHGKGTELAVELAGSLSIGEFLLFTLICSASSAALYKASQIYNDCFHGIVAMLILAVGPPAFFALRKSQEQKLFDFLHSIAWLISSDPAEEQYLPALSKRKF